MAILKEKIQLEFSFGNCSVVSLWNFISTPNGLSEWFADNVTQNKNKWTFHWGESSQQATLLFGRSSLSMKFRWIDDCRDYYFEMKIVVDDVTSLVGLVITDFIEEEEIEDHKLLWSTQIDNLMRCMGV